MRIVRKWFPVGTLLIIGGLCGYALFGPYSLFAQVSGDGVPPTISNITITNPTPTSTVIAWDTDEDADSEVNYGLDKNYGIARDALPNKKKHEIVVSDLEPSMVYHLRIGSADAGGNQALTGDYVVVTKGTQPVKNIQDLPKEEQAAVERAVTAVEEIKTAQGLQAVAAAVGAQASKVLEPPVIIGNPHIDEIGTDYAVISWASDQDAGSVVHYARDLDYNANNADRYTTDGGDHTERTKDHKVRITGLVEGTLYHFQVESEADLGMKGISQDNSFTTKASLPAITSFHVLKVEADSATLTWRTSVPAGGTVEYTDTRTKEVKSAGSPVFAASHTVKVAGLRLGTRYSAVVKAENALGDKVNSNTLYFTTVKDTSPPIISRVSNESTLYPSEEAKVQTIVSWTTDEPSYCQFFFRSGMNPNVDPTGDGEEKEPRTNHVQVVVEFLPSTVYQFWVECRDGSNNKTKSENFVLFTPNKEKSIIDIILENFQGTFGWVKNIGK